MKAIEEIINKIKELRNEGKGILAGIETLSDTSERFDLCSPKESAWRKLNRIHGQVQSLEWILEQ